MKWWRRFTKAEETAKRTAAAAVAEIRAAAAAEHTRRLARWPPRADLEPDEYAARVAAALGRRHP